MSTVVQMPPSGAEHGHSHSHGHGHSHGAAEQELRQRGGGGGEEEDGYEGAHPPLRSHHSVALYSNTGGFRAATLGFSDGLVSVLSLILGVHGERCGRGRCGQGEAHSHTVTVGLTGLAGLLAGAASMAAGEWISVHTQREATLAQLAVEKQHLLAFPQEEASELQECLEQKLGVSPATAAAVIRDIQHSDDSLARMLTLHAKFEHGINPERLGSPLHSAVASYCSFAVGGAVPLLPWFLVGGDNWRAALYISCCLSAAALLLYDAALLRLVAFMVAPPRARATAWAKAKLAAVGGLRQLGVGAIAAGTTYGVGVLLGNRA